MSTTPWRGTILFVVILVVLGATVGLKLYGLGEETTSAQTSIRATAPTPGPSTTGTTPSSTPSGTPTPAAPTATASPATTVITGSAVDTRYGAVQVKVTFSGTRITAVDTIQSPDGSGRDIAINQQAIPILQQEVLASQSANIDTVSGATYTSEGYIRSVQSAIDRR